MPTSKDPARKLAQFRKLAKSVAKTKIDWSSCPPEARAAEANRATTLLPFGYDQTTVRGFFREFNLDPANPWHWRQLLFFLIESYSRKAKRMHWSDERLGELLERSQNYRAKEYPRIIKDSEI